VLLCELLSLRDLLLGLLHLLAGLVGLLLGLLELGGELLDLRGLLLCDHHLLLRGGKLAGQIFGLGTERITFVLHVGQLLAEIGLARGLCRLGGQLIDLFGQTVHLILELFVLRRQRTVALFGLGELGSRNLSSLSGLVASAGGLLGGGLQRRVLLLQGLHLGTKLGDLGIQTSDVRAKRLGRSTGNSLLAECFHRLRHLIEKIVDLIDVIAFLETHGLEGMLPNIFRRQQSHKTYTSLWA